MANRMTVTDKPKRFYVVRHSYYLIHEVPGDWDDQGVGFFFNESSHCADNEALTIGLVSAVGEHVCATCSHHKADPMAGFDTIEEAQAWRDKDGQTAMERTPRDRLNRLKKDGVLNDEEYASELKRLEAIEELL